MPDVRYELLREMMEIRRDVLGGVKKGILDADTAWAQRRADEAALWDRTYAQLGLLGAAISIVGTVVAATPPGAAVGVGILLTTRIASTAQRVASLKNVETASLNLANAAAAIGGGTQVVGGAVGMWATYYSALGKPNFVVSKDSLDQLGARLADHLDTLLGQTEEGWTEFVPDRDKLYNIWGRDPKYKSAFDAKAPDGGHDARHRLIMDKLYQGLGSYASGRDAFMNTIAGMVKNKTTDLYEVVTEYLPKYKKNAPTQYSGPDVDRRSTPVFGGQAVAVAVPQKTSPAYTEYMGANHFLQVFMKDSEYKRWKLRAHVANIPGSEGFLR